MQIKTILFDLGNVLMKFSHERMCQQIAAAFQVESEQVNELIFGSDLHLRFENGTISEEQFHEHLESKLGSRCSLEDLKRATGDIFVPDAEMQNVVDQLSKQGFRLVLLSNTCVTHFDWIQSQFDLFKQFDDFVLSYEVGASKPDAAIFEAALQKIQCAPEECFYTDDISAYVEVGRQHGFNAEVFTNAEQYKLDLRKYGVALA